MNLSDMVQLFGDYFDDEQQDVWSREKVIRALNASMHDVAWFLEDADNAHFIASNDYAVTSTSDDQFFLLPADFKRYQLVERVVANGDDIPAEWVDFKTRAGRRGPWTRTTSGNLTRPLVFHKGRHLGVVAPGEAYTLRVWYSFVQPDMDSDDDIPERIPNDLHELIVLGAVKRATHVTGREFQFQELYEQQQAKLTTGTPPLQSQKPEEVNYIHD